MNNLYLWFIWPRSSFEKCWRRFWQVIPILFLFTKVVLILLSSYMKVPVTFSVLSNNTCGNPYQRLISLHLRLKFKGRRNLFSLSLKFCFFTFKEHKECLIAFSRWPYCKIIIIIIQPISLSFSKCLSLLFYMIPHTSHPPFSFGKCEWSDDAVGKFMPQESSIRSSSHHELGLLPLRLWKQNLFCLLFYSIITATVYVATCCQHSADVYFYYLLPAN